MNRYFSWSCLTKIALLLTSCGSLLLQGQYVDPKVYKVRMDSFENIESMIAGKAGKRKFDPNEIPSPVKKARDPKMAYEAFLDMKKEDFYEKLENKYGIGQLEVEKERTNYVQNSGPKLNCSPQKSKQTRASARQRQPSAALMARARQVFSLFKDAPNNVPVRQEKNDETPASATDRAIFIDENYLKTYDLDAQNFLLAHEVKHLLEKHSSEEYLVEKLLKQEYGKLTPTMNQYLLELSRCNETIADVKGALHGGKSFIAGYKKFVYEDFKKHPEQTYKKSDATNSSHPADSHRLRQAKLLEKELTLLEEVEEKENQS